MTFDAKVLAATIAYCAANVLLMTLFAAGALGPFSFEFGRATLIVDGLVILLVGRQTRRPDFPVWSAGSCILLLVGVSMFDLWCLFAASAAV